MPDLPAHRLAVSDALLASARALSDALARLRFAEPVTHVYDPLQYAWAPHARYVNRFGHTRRRVVFLGMNPGPFGMMQTGVPFGEVAAVRDWMGIDDTVERPQSMHPKRPIEGFSCSRSEVSGRRLWGWAAARFGNADTFFEQAFVLNYCPLVWLEASGRNRTPVQLPSAEFAPVQQACDRHLAEALAQLQPEWAIGVGGFAQQRLHNVVKTQAEHITRMNPSFDATSMRIGQILHPSPASPAANRGWADAVNAQLDTLGVF